MRSATILALLFLLLLALARPVQASVTTVQNDWAWQDGKSKLTYTIDTAGLPPGWEAIIRRAIAKLNASNMGWQLNSTTGNAKVRIRGASLGNSPPAQTTRIYRTERNGTAPPRRTNTMRSREVQINTQPVMRGPLGSFRFGTANTQLSLLRVVMHELAHCFRLGHPPRTKVITSNPSIMHPLFPGQDTTHNPPAHQNTNINTTDRRLASQQAMAAVAPVKRDQYSFTEGTTEGWNSNVPIVFDPQSIDDQGGSLLAFPEGQPAFFLQSPPGQQDNINPFGILNNATLQMSVLCSDEATATVHVVSGTGETFEGPAMHLVGGDGLSVLFFDLEEAADWEGLNLSNVDYYYITFQANSGYFTGQVRLDEVVVIESSAGGPLTVPTLGQIGLLLLTSGILVAVFYVLSRRLNSAAVA